jgi:hypothetical protein
LDPDLPEVRRAFCGPLANGLRPLPDKRACRGDRGKVGSEPLDAAPLLIDGKKNRTPEFFQRKRLCACNKIFQLLGALDVSFEKDDPSRPILPDKLLQLGFEVHPPEADKKMYPGFTGNRSPMRPLGVGIVVFSRFFYIGTGGIFLILATGYRMLFFHSVSVGKRGQNNLPLFASPRPLF